MERMSLIAFAVLIVLASVCRAEIINVPDDQATIQGGIDAAEDGDTVLVQPGEYAENVDIGIKSIILLGNPDNPDEVVIDGGQNGSVIIIGSYQRNQSQQVVSGFTITNGLADWGAGGVYCMQCSPTLTHLVINNNSAGNFGGGISLSANRPATISDVQILNNSAAATGGGISIWDGTTVILDRVLIAHNGAPFGGGIYLAATMQELNLIGCTIVDNTSDNEYGGLWLQVDGDETRFYFDNTIVWNNVGIDICIPLAGEDYFANTDFEYCLIDGGQEGIHKTARGELIWGEGNIDADPLFADPDSGDFHLTAESPCIDAGDPDSPFDPDSTRADMGAFYFHQRDIEVEPDSLEFATLEPGSRDSLAITIRNIGLTWLQVELPEIAPADAPFTHSWDWEGPGDIPSESEYQFWVFFHPEAEAEYRATLTLVSDDPDEDTVSVLLIGRSVLGVDDSDRSLPRSFAITAIHPNPFNGLTIVSYQLPAVGRVSLMLYDITGRQVSIQELGIKSPGRHQAVIDGALLPTGVYWLSLGEQGGQQSIAKVVLVR
jgi:hypothetical protein